MVVVAVLLLVFVLTILLMLMLMVMLMVVGGYEGVTLSTSTLLSFLVATSNLRPIQMSSFQVGSRFFAWQSS